MNDLASKIKWLGYVFRDLSYHSNGKYSCRLFQRTDRFRIDEFWGDTPDEAIDTAIMALKLSEADIEYE